MRRDQTIVGVLHLPTSPLSPLSSRLVTALSFSRSFVSNVKYTRWLQSV
jgi:hypothetical protein